MFNPISTYRIQFHKDFTFKNFSDIIPYLHKLGVNTVYASPIFEAAPGSNHGYDVINPLRINPEIGTLEELQEISEKLKGLQMNWLQDIVPNHMAFHCGNSWLMDVLENGRASKFSSFFDINWEAPAFNGRLMVPFLGNTLPDVIRNNELSIAFKEGKFWLCYADQQYPINLDSVIRILGSVNKGQPAVVQQLLANAKYVKDRPGLSAEVIAILKSGWPAVKKFIDQVLDIINQNNRLLQQIADEQYYQLSYWQDSDRQINYRRFFTVNGLICLNIQDEEVFTEYHRFIKELLDQGLFQGLRIDHIDGLSDPKSYLERLRALAGEETYIVVEKILEDDEQFPLDWPVQGNTGYDFLGMVNNLFTSVNNKKLFTDFYRELADDKQQVGRSIFEKKAAILYHHMGGELDSLLQLFESINFGGNKQLAKAAPGKLKDAIAEFLIQCPVYRYYGNQLPLNPGEARDVTAIFRNIATAKPGLKTIAQSLNKLFTGKVSEADKPGVIKFYRRCMQFTGPLMAKGVEDTLMYTYGRFIGHNEVGDSPDAFGIKISQFHTRMQARQKNWPLSINGTSTHDTKRGEDVRAKLNVLTDIPQEWFDLIRDWQQKYAKFKKAHAPDFNDEYLIYQTIAGVSQLPAQADDNLQERLDAYLTKALREAKRHTQWANPDETYEKGTLEFAQKLLNNGSFQKSLQALEERISAPFTMNALMQVLLKLTCPGVPDIYQGCELWDFSLVDPDNRRPVDYRLRSRLLKEVMLAGLRQLWEHRHNGACKLWLTNKLLELRKSFTKLFALGEYIPLQVKGKYRENLIAFARQYQRQWLIVIAPLHLAAVIDNDDINALNWEDTFIVLPDDAPLEWYSVLTNKKSILNQQFPVAGIFEDFPFGVLRSKEPSNKRSAGVIMHITSLPSPYGIGDLGPEARLFASFLSKAHQRYWQVLPVNPTEAAASYSPYSAFSAMAGNIMLISPDDLVRDGFLNYREVAKYQMPATNTVCYQETWALKSDLFETAFRHFADSELFKPDYDLFVQNERHWLDDFALYDVLKRHHNGLPWYKWPSNFKHRERKALADFSRQHSRELDKARWLQFIFFRQWTELKANINKSGITFMGDLPFYVGYDSVDVWANPQLFDLDADKNIAGVAGVPPDYFNSNGQLWSMPVYQWEAHKTTGYSWWINRMKRNAEFFDVIRLDHFRAFHDFWRVSAEESNAVNGEWRPSPGIEIFEILKKELGKLPFVAEDLGDINEGVYKLRDRAGLPGMNVLQYAFGEDMPVSVHAPHNHVINSITYTGTHDNNTTLGWFNQNCTPIEHLHLSAYFKIKVNRQNVNRLMNELCYSSVASLAILPMQDILRLDHHSRLNMPASKEGNWLWRFDKKLLTEKVIKTLKLLVRQYNR